MSEVDRRLVELAAKQHGVFSRKQAREAGLSYSGLSRRIERGGLVVAGSRALHLPGTVLTWYGELTAGLIDLGPGALVSGRGGAQLLGLDGFESHSVDFLAPRSLRHRTTISSVTFSSDISLGDRTTIHGLPCTSATRTVIELLRDATLEEAGNALDSACRKRLTAIPVIERRLNELGRQGRDGVAAFEQLIRAGRVESWLERRFVELIERARLPAPVLQRRYRLPGIGVARVDFEYPLWGVVVEVGGQRGYLSLDERRRKERRRNALQLEGKTIYFFTRDDIVGDPAYVVRTLAAALGIERSESA